MAQIKGLHSASLFFRDYARTLDFYIDALGFHVEERSERAAVLRAGDFRLLVHVGGPPGAPDTGMHLHLWVDDVDEFRRRLLERGVEAPEEPQDRPWGLRTFHVKDPNGLEWEFVQKIQR